MKKTTVMVAVLLMGLYLAYSGVLTGPSQGPQDLSSGHENVVENAYRNRSSNVQVKGRGTVTRLLADDTKGSRHQKFLIQLASGHSLLIVHNIDLAPRVESLQKGDIVDFHGEYEFNEKGGLVHWTHHDPKGRHIGGWIKHRDRTYQ